MSLYRPPILASVADPMAIILAGGGSQRMGADKALVEVGGRPMIDWVADAARAALGRVVIVGRSRGLAGLEAIPDAGPGRLGPLGGIHTALAAFRRPVVAVAIDQPLVRAATLERLARFGDPSLPAVPIDDGWEQVTCARYPIEWLEETERELRDGGSVRTLLRRLPWQRIEPPEWRTWGEDGRSWFSIDTPADVVTAEQRYRLDLHPPPGKG